MYNVAHEAMMVISSPLQMSGLCFRNAGEKIKTEPNNVKKIHLAYPPSPHVAWSPSSLLSLITQQH
jgi:hypothetical protein